LLETIESSQQQLNTYQQTINQLLIENAFHSESAVSEILAQNLNVDIERKTIEEFLNTLKNTQELLVNLRKDYGNFTYNAEQHAEVSAKKQTISEQLNYQRKEEGRIDGILRKAQEDLSKKIGLLNAKNELEIRGQHLEDLGKLFRGNGFVDFVSSIYLQNLCHAANVRFHKMTRQQLHLELGEDNSFWVRDVMNGGKSRLLKTLSGGQKFQAALSLALALADNIHTLTESKHNFFFLDEGFGSLDRESLQVVFETLKSLRKENRIVGIISHVEDLQQEIDRYLKVHNSEEFGSVVEMN
jgi:exonuclease SbcC